MSRMINMAGQRCGRLFVIDIAERAVNGTSIKWNCLCDCGIRTVVAGTALRSGKTKSCGCLKDELTAKRFRKHLKGTELLQDVRKQMIIRCYLERSSDYKWYGARGIEVCREWLNDPVSFTEWALKSGYKKGLSLDRIDNDGDYCPENCRWATPRQQANNRSNNHVITYGGKDYTLSQASREFDIHVQTLRRRIVSGWSVNKAIETPPRAGRNQYD